MERPSRRRARRRRGDLDASAVGRRRGGWGAVGPRVRGHEGSDRLGARCRRGDPASGRRHGRRPGAAPRRRRGASGHPRDEGPARGRPARRRRVHRGRAEQDGARPGGARRRLLQRDRARKGGARVDPAPRRQCDRGHVPVRARVARGAPRSASPAPRQPDGQSRDDSGRSRPRTSSPTSASSRSTGEPFRARRWRMSGHRSSDCSTGFAASSPASTSGWSSPT
jgi:hypothetical protein